MEKREDNKESNASKNEDGENGMPRTSPPASKTKKPRTSAPASKTKQSKAVKEPAPEKRAKRYRASCPKLLRDRLERAVSQRMYLVQQSELPDDVTATSTVQCTVLGSTGNVYTVTIGLQPQCTCPDFGRRHDICKHVIFVLLKVVGLTLDTPLAYQKAYVTSELKELFSIWRSRRVGGAVLANAQVRAAVGALGFIPPEQEEPLRETKRRSLEEDSDCPICFDDLGNALDALTYCRGTCGANFHAACLTSWLLQASSQNSCPNCRQPWCGADPSTHTAGSASASASTSSRGGYVNVGTMQGMSPVRDERTYYNGPRRGRPHWY